MIYRDILKIVTKQINLIRNHFYNKESLFLSVSTHNSVYLLTILLILVSRK